MRVKVIINPASRQGDPILRILDDVFASADIDWDVDVTHRSGDAFRDAKRSVADGYDLVCSVGGDGTVSEVAAALCGSKTPMAILPGGTGNGLAEDLGIPGDIAEAGRLISSGSYDLREVDMGRSGEGLFVLRLTMGFEASVVEAATREMKDRFGWLAYAFTTLQTLADPPHAVYHVEVDGERHSIPGIACIVANSASTGVLGLKLSPQVSASDGLLDVIVAETADLTQITSQAMGGPEALEPVGATRWQGKRIRVDAEPAQTVLCDGEDSGMSPIEVSIVPKALRIVVPKPV